MQIYCAKYYANTYRGEPCVGGLFDDVVEVLGLQREGLFELGQQLQHGAPVRVVGLLQVDLVGLGD